MLFDIEHGTFLNEFYEKLRIFSKDSYRHTTECLVSNEGSALFGKDNIPTYLIINKAIFQNLFSFYNLIDSKMFFPACNCLRAFLESNRLFRAVVIDEQFRSEYIENSNCDFWRVYDNRFMQGNIIKLLENSENESRQRAHGIIIGDVNLTNHYLTKNSPISELHSELSKWCHLNNYNLLLPTHITDSKFYLGIETDMSNRNIQNLLKKYIEGAYWLLTSHLELFGEFIMLEDFEITPETMLEYAKKYIKLFYYE